MKYVFVDGEVVTPHSVIDSGVVAVEEKKIKSVSQLSANKIDKEYEVINCAGKILMPGFIDVHTHGALGYDFTDEKPDTCSVLSRHYYAHGVTTLLATLSPLSHSLLIPAVHRLAGYCGKNREHSNIYGIHLEGPYLNRAMRGGNRGEYFETPEIDKWREVFVAGQGYVRLMTVAPELTGIISVMEDAIRNGVVIALGHSSADGETAQRAINLGAKQVTHVFNSMPPLHHREVGILAESLLSDKLDVQLIADGAHVHPKIIKLATKVKGADHIMLITDSIRATEVGDGEYYSAGEKVSVRNGIVHLENGTLAGSTLVLEKALRLIVREVGVDLPEASRMVSLNAARSLGIDKETGSIEANKRADIVVLDGDFNVDMTMRAGQIEYKRFPIPQMAK
ncbi:MAG: N-acetylglucosamine-6-phosphate deacetylase [Bacteroidetes bacterium]|nr:N-acetylglucosamine-6-phosphate deacetylase [Bacteroidota bacterium]